MDQCWVNVGSIQISFNTFLRNFLRRFLQCRKTCFDGRKTLVKSQKTLKLALKSRVWRRQLLAATIYEHCRLTWIATVTQVTHWRFLELVNIEPITVTDPDIRWPTAAVIRPVKAHFDSLDSLCHGGMIAWKPPWRMRTAAMLWYTRGGHFAPGRIAESVPFGCQWTVTCWITLVTTCSFCIAKVLVVNTFWKW